ncbi:MAG TPA: hypothetical protein VM364_04450 [Vicinamibacterales bacterium]|nr:hypothetical protein [Vicinamibacterales bacterium]
MFLMLLEANYVMAYVACETRNTWFMHLATAVALLLVAGAGYAAWSGYDGNLREDAQRGVEAVAARVEGLSAPGSKETNRQRSRWMSLGGIIISIWFFVVILALEIPILVLKECQ